MFESIPTLVVVLVGAISVLFCFLFPLILAGPMTWAERRQSAMIQDRVGPNRAWIQIPGTKLRLRALGLLHPVADVIKLISKEDSVNETVDRLLYNLAPMIALFPALVTFAVLPFGPELTMRAGELVIAPFVNGSVPAGGTVALQAAKVDIGILYIFAITSLAVFGVTLSGYASASKFALMGGLRASAQMISYEVTLGLSLMGLIVAFGSLEPGAMVYAQGELLWGWLPRWGVFVQPLGFIVFLTAVIAENKRIPFDVAEGESEIIGYFVEYSGLKFGMFFMGEYIEIGIIAGVLATLFFGGWQVPFLMHDGFHFGATLIPIAGWLVVALCIAAFVIKVVVLCWFQLMIRWSLPRFRYDQIMNLCWKVLLPLSLANLLVTAYLQLN